LVHRRCRAGARSVRTFGPKNRFWPGKIDFIGFLMKLPS
jgi:hypothetical protein